MHAISERINLPWAVSNSDSSCNYQERGTSVEKGLSNATNTWNTTKVRQKKSHRVISNFIVGTWGCHMERLYHKMPYAARLFGDYYFEEEINYFHFIAYLWRWQPWANVGSEFSKLISRLISNVNMSWWVLSQKLRIHQNLILNLHKSMLELFMGEYLGNFLKTDREMLILILQDFPPRHWKLHKELLA